MARAITKTFGSKSVEITIRRIVNGELVTERYSFANCKSKRAAEMALRKQLKTDNFITVHTEVKDGGETTKYTMSADDFDFLSEYCQDGVTYGHDTVTVTMKETVAEYYTMNDTEPQEFTMVGVTTERKLRKMIADAIEDENILVGEIMVHDVRKYMSKDDFIAHATVVSE